MTGSVGSIDGQPPVRSSFLIASILQEEPMIVKPAPEVREKKPEDSEGQEIQETQKTTEKAQGHEILEEEKLDDSEGQNIHQEAQDTPEEALEQDSEAQEVQDEVMDEAEELKASEEHFKWFGKHYDDTGKSGLDILADVVHQMDLEVPEVEIPTGYSLHSANRKDKTISARKAWGKLSKVRRKEWDSKANEMFDEEWKLGKVRKVKKEAKGKKKKVMRGRYMGI